MQNKVKVAQTRIGYAALRAARRRKAKKLKTLITMLVTLLSKGKKILF